MNKIVKIVLLISSVVFTTGCSTPKTHKPSFKKYGSLVPVEVFSSTYSRLLNTSVDSFIYQSKNGEGYTSTHFSKRTNIKMVQSAIMTYSNLTVSKKSTLSGQNEISSTIDPLYDRYSLNVYQKYYTNGDGDYFEGYLPNGVNKYYSNQNEYGEVLNGSLYRADTKRRTVTSLSGNYAYSSFFNSASLGAFTYFSDVAISDSDYYKYYVNGDTLTIVYLDTRSSVGIEKVYQITLGTTLKYKSKTIEQGQGLSDGIATSIKLETYVDLTIEKTIQSVKRVDYSHYTPITDYYY